MTVENLGKTHLNYSKGRNNKNKLVLYNIIKVAFTFIQ